VPRCVRPSARRRSSACSVSRCSDCCSRRCFTCSCAGSARGAHRSCRVATCAACENAKAFLVPRGERLKCRAPARGPRLWRCPPADRTIHGVGTISRRRAEIRDGARAVRRDRDPCRDIRRRHRPSPGCRSANRDPRSEPVARKPGRRKPWSRPVRREAFSSCSPFCDFQHQRALTSGIGRCASQMGDRAPLCLAAFAAFAANLRHPVRWHSSRRGLASLHRRCIDGGKATGAEERRLARSAPPGGGGQPMPLSSKVFPARVTSLTARRSNGCSDCACSIRRQDA